MNPKCDCGLPYSFVITCEKDDQLYHFWQCPACGKPVHEIAYKYSPMDGKHKCQWEFLGHKFVDDHHHHSILQLDRCSKCGGIRETPRDTNGAGLSGRIEIEDPRVKLLLNQSSWERMVPKEIQEMRTTPLPKAIVLPPEG